MTSILPLRRLRLSLLPPLRQKGSGFYVVGGKGLLLMGLALAGAPPLQETPPAPVMCRVVVEKVAARLLLGRGILERPDARGVPPEQKARRDALARALDESEAKVLRIDARFGGLKPSDADKAAFDAMDIKQQEKLFSACAEAS